MSTDGHEFPADVIHDVSYMPLNVGGDTITPRDLFYAAAIGAYMNEQMRQLVNDEHVWWNDLDVCELANDMADAAMKARK